MTPNEKRKWVRALRSGEYYQARGALRSIGQRRNHLGTSVRDGLGFCCLGVAEAAAGAPRDGGCYLKDAFLPDEIQGPLTEFNDCEDIPFELIAGFIDTWVEPTN